MLAAARRLPWPSSSAVTFFAFAATAAGGGVTRIVKTAQILEEKITLDPRESR